MDASSAEEFSKTFEDQRRALKQALDDLKHEKDEHKTLKLQYVQFNEVYTKHVEAKKLELFYMTQKAFRLSEAFGTYAMHLPGCNHPGGACSCGLSALELEGVEKNGKLYRFNK